MKAIDYAKQACDTMMRKFAAEDLPPKGGFHYHQGVFLSGMMNTYEVCGEEKYFVYIKQWVDSIIYADGSIHSFDKSMLDDIQPGILLYPLYRKTGDERYKIALNTLIDVLRTWKKNPSGGFWHKECHPNQMWLDSLYMCGPIQAEFAQFSGESHFMDTAAEQAVIMFEHMYDEKTGLMFHAWDESKEEEWADKTTGLSPEIWGRALGWYVVAILDILELMQENHPLHDKLIAIEQKLLANLAKYQDKTTGLWYQVVPKGDKTDNWTETSCSCLFTYAMAKAKRMGVIGEELLDCTMNGYQGVVASLKYDGDDLLIDRVCVGTGVCDYQGYIERPTSVNDLHGMGAFLLMCAEIARADG